MTKPETINYRTLKPEKDGLFDERIFGPTRDWECYCGKYKRIRYKGIICDKCGVEVTRSKVRRERMGHIQLASPVSHIWYFKGTPSRLGILLDISPRNLERILYFALYIVTHVDEDARQRALRALEEQSQGRGGAGGERLAELETTLKTDIRRQSDELRAALATTKGEIDAQRNSRIEEIAASAKAVEDALGELGKGEATDTIAFAPTGEVVVAAGDKGGKEALSRLRKIATAESDRVTSEQAQRASDEERGTEQKVQDLQAAMDEALRAEREQARPRPPARRRSSSRPAPRSRRSRRSTTIGETEFRQLDEKYGSGAKAGRIFWAGMGAEAVRDIIVRMDLDEMSRALHAEVRTSSGQRRKKAIKRLRLIEAFRRSGNRPEWMILSVLPVIPPDLRPMVQLDGGRVRDLGPQRPLPPRDQPEQPAQAAPGARRAGDHHPQREADAPGGVRRPDRQRPPRPRDRRHWQPPPQEPVRHAQGQAGPVPPEPAGQARRLLRPLGHRRRPGPRSCTSAACPRRWRSSCSSRS